MIDAYAHIGMPRFHSVEAYRAMMQRMGIRKALICAFDCCTDLASIHRAMSEDPDNIRGLGLALGRDRGETERGIAAQIASGMIGLRLNVADVRDRPWLLEALAAHEAFPFVVGEKALAEAAPALVSYLDKHPTGFVAGGHFAGPTNPAALTKPGAVRDLFSHPRFVVVWSRQGIFPTGLIADWSAALMEMTGWSRALWGTEAPVLYWRDEKVSETPHWIERFKPDAAQREAFFTDNSERLIFARPRAPVSPLKLDFDPRAYEVARDVPMWPFGLRMRGDLPGRLIHGWLAWGGEDRGPLSHYLDEVLDGALPRGDA